MSHGRILTVDTVIQRKAGVIQTTVDQDIVMVSIDTGNYYGVSSVARDIWEAIEQPIRIGDLINRLVAAYDIEFDVCAKETLSFLETLRAEKLLQNLQ
jgi:hypothetical protein